MLQLMTKRMLQIFEAQYEIGNMICNFKMLEELL